MEALAMSIIGSLEARLRRSVLWSSLLLAGLAAVTAQRLVAQDGLPQATDDAAADEPPAADSTTRGPAGAWRSSAGISRKTVRPPAPATDDAPTQQGSGKVAELARRPDAAAVAPVTGGLPGLPSDAGQQWRTYNIRPYTLRVTSTNRPEQAIVDWILRETGYETWHSETVALLNADANTLYAYHTPEVQAVVADVVDRFVNVDAESHAFGLRVVTVGSPNWRARAHAMLQPLPTQTQGIQAWLIHKEDYALLMSELRKRLDFREHSSPHLMVNHGQSTTVSAIRPHTYVKDMLRRPDRWPGYEPEVAQFDEGFSLELSPLLALDGRTIDAVVRCNIDQLERLVPVQVDMAAPNASRDRRKIEIPQITHCGLHERFRWPADQVLVVGLGVVATPVPGKSNILAAIPGLGGPPRADLLVFIESRGKAGQATDTSRTGMRDSKSYRNRY
jgi:hypothetical protein